MKRNIYLYLILSLVCGQAGQAKEIRMESPNGKYQLVINDNGGRIHYTLDWDGRQIIRSSRLGIFFNGIGNEHFSLCEPVYSEQDTTWHPVYGERSTIRDHYKACSVELKREGGDQRFAFQLDFRLYDEGIAFRYHFTGIDYLKIEKEYTEFAMPEGTMAWFTPGPEATYDYVPLKGWEKESERPLLMKLTDGTFVNLTEAAVVDYVRTKFALSKERPNTLVTSMYGPVEDVAPYPTPWRVITCAHTPGEILEHNDLIFNLNPPCQIEDPSWIKPGKSFRVTELSTKAGKAGIDFAVKHNMQYISFDSGWYGLEDEGYADPTKIVMDLDLKEVCRYGKERGIGVYVYVNYRGLIKKLDELIPLLKEWGVCGIKFGFVRTGSQVWNKWLHEAVKKCADNCLIVDIHDDYRPTGFSRTYPNLLTQEGIYANEQFPDATHNVTLPFTRFSIGTGDYLICYYARNWDKWAKGMVNTDPNERSLHTTPAHQLALGAIYYDPLQMFYYYDSPSADQGEPELKFWDDIYTVWDDSKVLHGEVGEYITVARRHGEEWFLGSITNNDARQLDVDLSFLPAGQEYIAEIYTDGDKSIKTRTRVKVSTYRVDAQTTLHFNLLPSGGSAVRLLPIEQAQSNKHPKYKNQKL